METLWYNPNTGQTGKSLPEITGLNDNDGCYEISTNPARKYTEISVDEARANYYEDKIERLMNEREHKCSGCGCNTFRHEDIYKECVNCFQRYELENGEWYEIETPISAVAVKEDETELPEDCQSKEDGVCFLPIGSCKMCVSTVGANIPPQKTVIIGDNIEVIPENPCICDACNKAYAYDLTVPDELWAVIAPKKMDGWKSGGLLCPECILDKTIKFFTDTILKLQTPEKAAP
ncbi:MAG: hypothetical protein V4547_17160 [Bacteroidota bacterium]